MERGEQERFMEQEMKIHPWTASALVNKLLRRAKDGDYRKIIRDIVDLTKDLKTNWMKKTSENENDVFSLFDDEKDAVLLKRFENNNGIVFPVKFFASADKDENLTSRWFVVTLLSMMIHYVTGCRIVVTQDYGNISLIESRSIISLDNPPIYVKRIFGSEIELAGGDIHDKFIIGIMLWYLNDKYNGDKDKDNKENTIAHIIERYIERPHKLIDLCWRYSDKCKRKKGESMDKYERRKKHEFYRISHIVHYLTK